MTYDAQSPTATGPLRGGAQKTKTASGRSPIPPRSDGPPHPPPTELLQHRVDWLTVAGRVRLAPHVADALRTTLDAAYRLGETELRVGELRFASKRCEARNKVSFYNADVRGAVDLAQQADTDDGHVGWTMVVDVSGGFLARHTFGAVLAALEGVFAAFGDVLELTVRRVDLAADFKGFDIREDDAINFKRPSGPSRLAEWIEVEDPTTTRYHRGTKMTGITICPGGDLMARVYDKCEELKIRRDAQKTSTEQEVWTWSGWKPGDAVTRVEFQFRSPVLKEFDGFDARDPRELAKNLDALWRYAVEKWCSLIVRDDERTSRCSVDPRWRAVQDVRFAERQRLPRRHRKRAGASAGQAIGCCLSIAAGAGLVHLDFADLVVGDEVKAWHRVDKLETPELLKRAMWKTTWMGLRQAICEWVDDHEDVRDAAEKWTHRKRAAVARFNHLPATEKTAVAA